MAFRILTTTEAWAATLAPNYDTTALLSQIPSAAGLTPTQYATVKQYAQTYMNNLAQVHLGRKLVLANIVAAGHTPATASTTEESSLVAAMQAEKGLIGAQMAALQSADLAAYTAFGNYARSSVAARMTRRPLVEECPDCGTDTIPEFDTYGDIMVDPVSGQAIAVGVAEIVVEGWASAYGGGVSVWGALNGNQFLGSDNCGFGAACTAVGGTAVYATSPGAIFTLVGGGSGSFYGDTSFDPFERIPFFGNWTPQTATWNPQPVITQVIPSVWTAGATTNVTLCGYNFGIAAVLTVDDDLHDGIQWNNVMVGADQGGCGGSSQVSFQVSVPANAIDNENVRISLGVSDFGNGF